MVRYASTQQEDQAPNLKASEIANAIRLLMICIAYVIARDLGGRFSETACFFYASNCSFSDILSVIEHWLSYEGILQILVALYPRSVTLLPTYTPSISPMKLVLRRAVFEDVARLRTLIHESVRRLQAMDYSSHQIENALTSVYGVDTQLIADGTYFVVEADPDCGRPLVVGCGGWSQRRTLYGADQWRRREDALLDPATEAAKIRAFFVHPDWVRRGIGSMILEICQKEALESDFTRLEIAATLTSVPLYIAHGFVEIEPLEVPLASGEAMVVVRMEKGVHAAKKVLAAN